VNYENAELAQELAMVKRISNGLYHQYQLWKMDQIMDKEELYHHGVIGLMDAKKKYDPGKGKGFMEYAAYRIRGEMISALRTCFMVRLPQKKQNQVKALKRAREKLIETGRSPSLENLGKELGWPKAEILSVELLMVTVLSRDDQAGEELPRRDPLFLNPEQALERSQLAQIIARCMDLLENAAEKMILTAREYSKVPLKQLACQLGCSIQTVCNRHSRAKQQMKSCLEQHGLNPKER